MARFQIAGTATIAGTTLRPPFSLYSVTNSGFWLVELAIVNTTDVACEYSLVRLEAAGTQGAALTEIPDDPDTVAVATGFAGHTADLSSGEVDQIIRRTFLGAAKGSAMIWTFGGRGIRVPKGTANGIGPVAVGTGQILDYWAVWDE